MVRDGLTLSASSFAAPIRKKVLFQSGNLNFKEIKILLDNEPLTYQNNLDYLFNQKSFDFD